MELFVTICCYCLCLIEAALQGRKSSLCLIEATLQGRKGGGGFSDIDVRFLKLVIITPRRGYMAATSVIIY